MRPCRFCGTLASSVPALGKLPDLMVRCPGLPFSRTNADDGSSKAEQLERGWSLMLENSCCCTDP